eukprot:UN00385
MSFDEVASVVVGMFVRLEKLLRKIVFVKLYNVPDLCAVVKPPHAERFLPLFQCLNCSHFQVSQLLLVQSEYPLYVLLNVRVPPLVNLRRLFRKF